ncbi:hypothetical protein D8Y22_16170 [Salinadaptatus halalkaliphilus]|uniref:SRPBCC family protein n=1 Tax=Salinadaptatus halalkaliphilus TaxID=2419781 RepID=A0A4S3TJW6_9EURY|nr:hypothetical protein [Salinadaptatus halalkaliphilus]THE63860.1 hypothetical protein D8Y22_16170 [Salinadaptatus halalkaliphilus]
MHTVELSYTVEPSAEELLASLSPTAIVEYADIFAIESHETVGETDRMTVSFDENTMVLEFVELSDGYEYTMVDGSGLFATRQSTIRVKDESETEVTATMEYTLDSRLAFVLNYLAAKTVRRELELTVENLVAQTMDAEPTLE